MAKPFPSKRKDIRYISSGELLETNFLYPYAWEDVSSGGGAFRVDTLSGKQYMVLDSSIGSSYAMVQTNVGTSKKASVISLRARFVGLAAKDLGGNDNTFGCFKFMVYDGTSCAEFNIHSDGIFGNYGEGPNVDLGAGSIAMDTWMLLTFVINWTTGIITVYKNGSLLCTSSVSCIYSDTNDQGLIQLYVEYNGFDNNAALTYIDSIRIGSRLV